MLKKIFACSFSIAVILFFSSAAMGEAHIYVGSKNSGKYHRPSCNWARNINPQNKVVFNSAKDAVSKGFLPCEVCKPPVQD